jgi:hypothetical protein
VGAPKFDAMAMTRSASVKYVSAEVRMTPDLAPVWVNNNAGNSVTDDAVRR